MNFDESEGSQGIEGGQCCFCKDGKKWDVLNFARHIGTSGQPCVAWPQPAKHHSFSLSLLWHAIVILIMGPPWNFCATSGIQGKVNRPVIQRFSRHDPAT